MKINQNDRKRKFFGQISFEYEHNANLKLTEKDFTGKPTVYYAWLLNGLKTTVKMKMIGIILFFMIKI